VTDLVAPKVREMDGAAALPRLNGELVFDAPWQGRALGMAVGVVGALDLNWDQFRQRLISAIADDPDRPYYESWVAALESLVVAEGLASPDELALLAGAGEIVEEPGMGRLEVFALPTDEPTLLAIITDLFENWWSQIRFGPIIQGAVFEGRASAPPRHIGVLDGYVTVDLDGWHFHLCIGEHHGDADHPVPPELAHHRRCHRAELYRVLHHDAPVSWGLRLLNGADEQQITVLLPNPFLDDDQRPLPEPDWTRLACWDHLREDYLGLASEQRDRTADRFHHS
jgi:nitrile hydratase accessory protein